MNIIVACGKSATTTMMSPPKGCRCGSRWESHQTMPTILRRRGCGPTASRSRTRRRAGDSARPTRLDHRPSWGARRAGAGWRAGWLASPRQVSLFASFPVEIWLARGRYPVADGNWIALVAAAFVSRGVAWAPVATALSPNAAPPSAALASRPAADPVAVAPADRNGTKAVLLGRIARQAPLRDAAS
jgi:hypothetical protein